MGRLVGFVRTGKISRAAFGALLLASVAASGGVGWRVGWQAPPPGWTGKVARIVRGGGSAELRGKTPLAEGAAIASGVSIATDRKQRARLEMNDGSVLVLDRDTEIELDGAPLTRTVHVKHGVVAFDVAHKDNLAPAKIITERGEVLVVGTELTVTATDDTTDVQVTRGSVRAKAEGGRDVTVEAGQEALLSARGVDVGPSAVGARAADDGLLGEKKPNDESEAGGVGELRARRPGHADENDRALRVENHAVKVRIAGAMARTEIEETFSNDTNDDLEGIYRFPVPAGALVDRLALDVDGNLQEGAFVEKTRAEKILKGAIANATAIPQAQSDIVWVPGPWRDPALLEWQQGGRFQLRIFPIPKHGSRRVVLGYTQTVDASLGVRRYVYPLPSAGDVRMDHFSVDAQVLGADGEVHARGYDLAQNGDKLSFQESAFKPSGDLRIEYTLANRKSELSTWTFDSGEKFAALAIRPRLPANAESKPRDWVVVVDDGRSMFGERFVRASRVAVSLAQTLDRRDRISVLACDVACRRNSAGFVPAGATAAKALADFLSPIVPDGASDLASAVRSATATSEAGRELRVVVVSDGVASAGYKRAQNLEAEVRDASPSDGAVLAVPVGADADMAALASIARGGGGVVVPYSPGERTEDVALALAGAGAGALLRDAKIELPQGFESVAPSVLPTMRVGGETYVVAKMSSAHVQGDVVLRGTAGGEPFEARYPIDVTASTDVGNAFVPRLFASLRIADLERSSTGVVDDASRTEAVALSQKLAVPSRFTSLLVLESEAMFRAFGIDRGADAPRWTGEVAGDAHDVATVSGGTDAPADESANAQLGLGSLGHGSGGGGGRGGGFADDLEARKSAAPMTSAAPTPTGQAGPMEMSTPPLPPQQIARDGWRRARPGRFMRRVFHREATIMDGGSVNVDASNVIVGNARAALAAAPDDRAKHRELARALLRRGSIDELEQVVSDWQKRDPLDPDAITLRAEVLSQRGDRQDAARVLSGIASSVDASHTTTLDELALGAERANDDARACALRVASAENRPDDPQRVARAVRCERTRGHAASADRWLTDAGSKRSAIDSALASLASETANVTGDVVVDATWSSGSDLDVAVIDPNGQRLGWLAGRGRVADPTSRSHEKLGISSSATGTFLVEIARSDAGTEVISGFVNVSAFGMSKRIPFVLGGPSARVARIDARWVSELVPIDGDGTPLVQNTITPRGTFDAQAAHTRVTSIPLESCSVQEGPFGAGSATVTFDPMSGAVSNVVVASPFTSTREAMCISRMLRSARVSPFQGSAQMVTRSFVIAP